MVINIILDRNLNSYNDLLNSKNLNQDIIDIYDVCISYIKNALKIFLQNSKDYMILETPYDIANLNINYIIKNIENDVIESNEAYRKEKGSFSSGLLALLWFYDKHDDVLLMLEEKYTEKYKKSQRINIVNVKSGPEQRKLNFVQSGKPTEFLKILKQKREKTIKEKEEKELQHALKEAKYLPDSYKKVLINSSINGNSEQGNSLLESLNLKSLLKVGKNKNDKNSTLINNEDYSKNKLQKNIINGISPKKNFAATLIQPEGSRTPFIPSRDPLLGKNLPVFLDYENEGEEREKLACNSLLKQYSRNLKQYFNFYVTEINNTIVKHNLMKMFREIGIEGESLNLDELNSIIRTTFGGNLNYVNKEQFEKMLIQLSYVIFSKIKPRLTVSMCFQEILKIISYWCKNNKLNVNTNSSINSVSSKNSHNLFHIGAYNKKMYNYLKTKVEGPARVINKNNLDFTEEEVIINNSLLTQNTNQNTDNGTIKDDIELFNEKEKKLSKNTSKIDILIPPGYKKILQTEVEYEYILPRDLVKNLFSDSYIVCYELLNEIIKKKFSSTIVEPYVRVYNELKLIEEPLEPKKRWGNSLTILYTKLEKKYEKVGKDCADVLEDILRAVSLGRDSIDKPKYLTDKERSLQEEKLNKEKERIEGDKLLKGRKKEIAKRLSQLKNEKSLEDKVKIQEEERQKKVREEKIKELHKNIEQKRKQMKQDVEKSKKEKEKQREEKEKSDKSTKEKQLAEKIQKKKRFFHKTKKKTKRTIQGD